MDKKKFLEKFNRQQHRLGRIMLISAALLLLAVQHMLGAIYGAFPDFKGFINGFIKVGIVYIPVGIVGISCLRTHAWKRKEAILPF